MPSKARRRDRHKLARTQSSGRTEENLEKARTAKNKSACGREQKSACGQSKKAPAAKNKKAPAAKTKERLRPKQKSACGQNKRAPAAKNKKGRQSPQGRTLPPTFEKPREERAYVKDVSFRTQMCQSICTPNAFIRLRRACCA